MIKMTIILASLLSMTAFADLTAETFPVKPDPSQTIGSFCNEKDPDFVGYRYKEKIAYCIRNVSRHVKAEIYRNYQVSENCWHEYTIDHYVPLSMGGSNLADNLWPEHKNVKATRQNLEQELYGELAKGTITRNQAVAMIADAKQNPPRVSPSKCK